jgi:hypothetical protein
MYHWAIKRLTQSREEISLLAMHLVQSSVVLVNTLTHRPSDPMRAEMDRTADRPRKRRALTALT